LASTVSRRIAARTIRRHGRGRKDTSQQDDLVL